MSQWWALTLASNKFPKLISPSSQRLYLSRSVPCLEQQVGLRDRSSRVSSSSDLEKGDLLLWNGTLTNSFHGLGGSEGPR